MPRSTSGQLWRLIELKRKYYVLLIKQHQVQVDLTGDESESEDEEGSSDGHPTSGRIGGYVSSRNHSDLELGEANLRSTFLQGILLSEKEPTGLRI